MTQRAKRLANYLESIGWTVYNDTRGCSVCNNEEVDYDKKKNYCSVCGAVLKEKKLNKYVEKDLEDAIKYALMNHGN